MGILETILGQVLGSNNPNGGALGSILSSVLASQGGVGGLVQKMNDAGLGNVVSSWVGNGTNQQISPDQLHQVLGRENVEQWSQETGMSHDTILSELSKLLPHAVDKMTPNGQVPADGGATSSAFDAPGLELRN